MNEEKKTLRGLGSLIDYFNFVTNATFLKPDLLIRFIKSITLP